MSRGVIVHEWVEKFGGAEQVVDAMMDTFPNADLVCAWDDAPDRYRGRRVIESAIARSPLRGHKAAALPAMTVTWRMLKSAQTYDWMLVSSHAFAHHARFRGRNRDIPKIAYVHTPARYLWTPELDERGSGAVAKIAGTILRPIDKSRASQITSVVANSEFIRKRIEDAWERESTVIYPPVDVDGIFMSTDDDLTTSDEEVVLSLPTEFILGISRFVPYKRLDLAIETAAASGLPVVLAGTGPQQEDLTALAAERDVPLTMIVGPSTDLLRALYRRASALVFPAIEDFGIVPVEAIASGTPVLVSDVGGTTETIIDGVNGAHLHSWRDVSSLTAAVERVRRLDAQRIRESSQRFATGRFQSEIGNLVERVNR